MTKTFCDRCEKELKKGEATWLTHKIIYATLRAWGSRRFANDFCEDKYICPECERDFEQWFKNGRNKDE